MIVYVYVETRDQKGFLSYHTGHLDMNADIDKAIPFESKAAAEEKANAFQYCFERCPAFHYLSYI
jgi:hypothetical protein